MQKVMAVGGLPFIPADGTTLYLRCGKYKNNFKHIEALKQCFSKSSYKYSLLFTNDNAFYYSSRQNTIGMAEFNVIGISPTANVVSLYQHWVGVAIQICNYSISLQQTAVTGEAI